MITVVTGNKNKAAEVTAFFAGVIGVSHVHFSGIEPQADTVDEIAISKAEQAYAALDVPLIVDDTGLFIDALSGFPGPYSSYVQDTIGNTGVLRLMGNAASRQAHFTTSIAYADVDGIRIFSGSVDGEITTVERGTGGFGYDPIFSVGGKTLAEMPMEEKNSLSHRVRALAVFRDWYLTTKSA
ncbi:MAG: RdgB/HAM1 family non-canonical purine NTP pyrophosphatase [Methanocalculaceae archaeon]|nr:RdgB/HAM1 family non-canonical purine NTP pyrophosphatase [Methanocalculaceae archaeon]